MAYQRGDNRYGGGDRWRDRDDRPNERSAYGERDLGRGYGRNNQDWGRDDRDRGGDDDRGFFERAGEQVRSWFGDDDDDHRGRQQRERGGYYGSDFNRSNDRYSAGDRGQDRSFDRERSGSSGPADTWGGSGFAGEYAQGRRFDRIDAGSTGTHGAHPMASSSGGAYGAGYGSSASGYGSSARSSAAMGGGRGAMSQGGGFGGGRGGDLHDRHYSEWRERQMQQLDQDYDEYRREHQSKFETEFGGWREKRQGQRQHMRRATEHMEVVGSDGQHIGTVDKVRGDRIILTKNDENAGGIHHSIPCSWIESVDDKVTVNKSASEAMEAWRDEERNRALFEREDQGSEGPHMLNRSFSGTYSDRND